MKVRGHENNTTCFLSSELSSDLMLFKKIEWELLDNQVHIKYYIFNKSNNKKNSMIPFTHSFNDI